jgi:hypothetical protein
MFSVPEPDDEDESEEEEDITVPLQTPGTSRTKQRCFTTKEYVPNGWDKRFQRELQDGRHKVYIRYMRITLKLATF